MTEQQTQAFQIIDQLISMAPVNRATHIQGQLAISTESSQVEQVLILLSQEKKLLYNNNKRRQVVGAFNFNKENI